MEHTFGITLSGGGIRGIAHAGVLQALEENGLQPTCISGASAGAMVGALYASGVKPFEILEILNHTSFFGFHNFNWRKPGFFNLSFLESLLKKHMKIKRFEDLPIEFHTVATNLITANTRVFSEGEIIPAVIASSSFPLVFSPIEIDGVLYSDGGITNNFPVNVIRNKCEHLLGVYVSPLHEIDSKRLSSSLKLADRVYRIAINYASTLKFDICDKIINPVALESYAMFDLNKANEIFEIGYAVANRKIKEANKNTEGKSLDPIKRFFSKV